MSDDVIRVIQESFAYKYAVKHYLWERQEYLCALCHTRVTYKKSTIDHIIPRSKGGLDRIPNYQIVHKNCNEAKADSLNEADIKPGINISEKMALKFEIKKKRRQRKRILLGILTGGIYIIFYKKPQPFQPIVQPPKPVVTNVGNPTNVGLNRLDLSISSACL